MSPLTKMARRNTCWYVSQLYDRWKYSLQWRHNERDGVSNHLRLDFLLNRLFRRRSKKTAKLRVTALCEGNPSVTGGTPHKGLVTRKMLPLDDVITLINTMRGIMFGIGWAPTSRNRVPIQYVVFFIIANPIIKITGWWDLIFITMEILEGIFILDGPGYCVFQTTLTRDGMEEKCICNVRN